MMNIDVSREIEEYWEKQKKLADCWNLNYDLQGKVCGNQNAIYQELTFQALDGTSIRVRYVRPAVRKAVRLVFDFHDEGQPVQGWFHLTRYVALGYAVAAMEVRGVQDCSYARGAEGGVDNLYDRLVYLDAYLMSHIMEQMEGIDTACMGAFGRGHGGAIALALCALNPKIKECSMEYPTLCDIRQEVALGYGREQKSLKRYFRMQDPMHEQEAKVLRNLDRIDPINLAPMVQAEVLMATAMLDTVSPPLCQEAVYERIAGKKQRIIFPRHEHELINAFEDENLKFLKFI